MKNNERIDPEVIGRSTLPSDTKPSGPIGTDPYLTDPDLDKKRGLLGRLFGYGSEKKGNIAGLAVIVGFAILALVILGVVFVENEEARSFLQTLVTPVVGIISGALGYVTGSRSSE